MPVGVCVDVKGTSLVSMCFYGSFNYVQVWTAISAHLL